MSATTSSAAAPEPLSARPMRADAARNRAKLLAAAREAFTADGAAASLEDIARRAGVGIGTLYRNFATRQELLEAVYVEEIETVCAAAYDFDGLAPWDALVAWLRSFGDYATTKKALAAELMAYLDGDAPMFPQCRQSIMAAGAPLLERAQQAGAVRSDAKLIDVMRMVGGIATIPNPEPGQVDRILDVALDGLRPQPAA